MTSGPCRVIVLTKSETGEGIVDTWREMIGPFDAAVAKENDPARSVAAVAVVVVVDINSFSCNRATRCSGSYVQDMLSSTCSLD